MELVLGSAKGRKMVRRSLRRDAANHTPEACAPLLNCRSGLSAGSFDPWFLSHPRKALVSSIFMRHYQSPNVNREQIRM